jgi:hypothetical protein
MSLAAMSLVGMSLVAHHYFAACLGTDDVLQSSTVNFRKTADQHRHALLRSHTR